MVYAKAWFRSGNLYDRNNFTCLVGGSVADLPFRLCHCCQPSRRIRTMRTGLRSAGWSLVHMHTAGVGIGLQLALVDARAWHWCSAARVRGLVDSSRALRCKKDGKDWKGGLYYLLHVFCRAAIGTSTSTSTDIAYLVKPIYRYIAQ